MIIRSISQWVIYPQTQSTQIMPQIQPSAEPLPMVAATQMKKEYSFLNLTINSSIFEVCLLDENPYQFEI